MPRRDFQYLNSDSALIFHRPKNNFAENLENQRAFLKENKELLKNVEVIDHETTPGYLESVKVFEIFEEYSFCKKVNIIMQNFLSKEESEFYYNMYSRIHFYKNMKKKISIYLMDSDGRLYEEVKDIKKIEW